MEREIFVHVDLRGASVLVGRLWWRVRKGRESASFEYDADWLRHPERFALEPALTLTSGPFHTPPEKALFGAIGDSAPDRWGRLLMRRAERRRATREGKTPRTLFEADILLRVDDEARQGALRFSMQPGGPFLAEPGGTRIPPLVELPRLLSAVEKVVNEEEDEDNLRLLIGPGSSLGGARPKASVRDASGRLAIAKFSHHREDWNVVLWEGVALTLASKAAINIPEWGIDDIAGRSVLMVRRFDRETGQRIPFLSAMSMLGVDSGDVRSYLDIAEALRRHGAAAKEDLRRLWRRIVFNVLISNTDDHLRNHGFLYRDNRGWRLSPAYDLNPTPTDVRPRILSTSISPDDPTASLDLASETAEYYGLNPKQARRISAEVAAAVVDWRAEADHLGLSRRETERMASAFQHPDLDKARRG